MTKAELISSIAKEAKITKKQAKDALDTVLDSIRVDLSQGQKAILTDIGTFTMVDRAARQGRNPQTGATIPVPAKKAVKFKAAPALKKLLNP